MISKRRSWWEDRLRRFAVELRLEEVLVRWDIAHNNLPCCAKEKDKRRKMGSYCVKYKNRFSQMLYQKRLGLPILAVAHNKE